jgi:hypothetical protein
MNEIFLCVQKANSLAVFFQEAMTNKEEPSVLVRLFEGEDEDLDFFKDSFSYQVGCVDRA